MDTLPTNQTLVAREGEFQSNLTALLNKQGVLVAVPVHLPRFSCKLEDKDLGLEKNKERSKFISLGRKHLLGAQSTTMDPFTTAEAKKTTALRKYTRPFVGGIGCFCPNEALESLNAELSQIKQDFDDAVPGFLAQYDAVRAKAFEEWEAYMVAEGFGDDQRQVVMDSIRSRFPLKHKVKFSMDVVYFEVGAPHTLDSVTEIDPGILKARAEAAANAKAIVEEQARTFAIESVTSLRLWFSELVAEVSDSIKKSTIGVHQKSLNRIKNAYEKIRQIDWTNDEQLRQLAEAASTELLEHTAEEYRDNESYKLKLQDNLAALKEATMTLAKSDVTDVVNRWAEQGARKFNL